MYRAYFQLNRVLEGLVSTDSGFIRLIDLKKLIFPCGTLMYYVMQFCATPKVDAAPSKEIVPKAKLRFHRST
jgi:hypothetical protein